MEKILDSEFRKGLYKSLTEAGYDKQEAQKIVGVKYYSALMLDVSSRINGLQENMANENFDIDLEGLFKGVEASVEELKKLKSILNG